MENSLIYLDHNATTPVAPEVLQAMQPFHREQFANPSSPYRIATEAAQARETAREAVAELLGCKSQEIIFTGCGTEADNLAIKGVGFARRQQGNHIITTKIEHHAVLKSCQWMEKQGFELTYLDVDETGRVSPEQVERSLRDDTILVTIMHANNEVGTVQPLQEIGELLADKQAYFHTDAVQTAGKIPFTVEDLKVDLLSISAHKIYGPKGVGALYRRQGTTLQPLLHGGRHENNLRAGTENIAGIVGLGAAARLARKNLAESADKRVAELRDRLEAGLFEKITDLKFNGNRNHRLPTTVNLSFNYIEGEAMLLHLDAHGIAVSSGSACTSGTLDASHVLLAMGVPVELAHGSLRFSLGYENTEADIQRVIDLLPGIVRKLREISPLYPGEQ